MIYKLMLVLILFMNCSLKDNSLKNKFLKNKNYKLLIFDIIFL